MSNVKRYIAVALLLYGVISLVKLASKSNFALFQDIEKPWIFSP